MDRAEFEDLLTEALAEICPHFSISEDRKGQLIVLTGLVEDPDTEELESIVDEDVDQDFNPDFEPLEELEDEDE